MICYFLNQCKNISKIVYIQKRIYIFAFGQNRPIIALKYYRRMNDTDEERKIPSNQHHAFNFFIVRLGRVEEQ